MRDETDGYQAYLLRLWRVRYQGRWRWRASIDSPHTGECQVFATLAGLFTFLKDKTLQETPVSGVDRQEVDRGSVPYEAKESHDV
jgi:hypothetical protein